MACLSATSWAHDGAHRELERLDARLEAEAADIDAWLDRAHWHHEHGDVEAALHDLSQATALRPEDPRLAWIAARIDAALGFDASAIAHVNRWLLAAPQDSDAYILRARLHRRGGELTLALVDYDLALARSATPHPDWYIERAWARHELGLEATSGLADGLARYATHPDLLEAAFAIARLEHRDAIAQTHLKTLETHFAGRRVLLAMLRGDLNASRGDPCAALASYDAARAALSTETDPALRRALHARLGASTPHAGGSR